MNTLRRFLCFFVPLALAFPAFAAESNKLALQFTIASKTKTPAGQTESRYYKNKLLLDFNTSKNSVFPGEYEMSLANAEQGKDVLLEVQLRDIQSGMIEVGAGKMTVPLGGEATLEFPSVGNTRYSVLFKAERLSTPIK